MTPTRDKLVERIAKQMVREAGNDPDEICYGRKGEAVPSMPRWHAMRPVARAILADLDRAGLCIVPREPTEGMIRAAEEVGGWDDEGRAADPAPGAAWRAMIAAAEGATAYFIPDDGVFIEADGTVRRIKPGEG